MTRASLKVMTMLHLCRVMRLMMPPAASPPTPRFPGRLETSTRRTWMLRGRYELCLCGDALKFAPVGRDADFLDGPPGGALQPLRRRARPRESWNGAVTKRKETNVHETSAVLDFARKNRVPTLVASTSEVYGKGSGGPMSEDDDVIYGPSVVPRWSYACSKAIDEYLALAHDREGVVPTVVVRFFNTVGPRQRGEYGMVLPRFVEACVDGNPIEVHGDGLQSRCFCDVRDVVKALPLLIEDAQHRGKVFNLGSDESITIRDLAELVRSRTRSESSIRFVDYVEVFDAEFEDLQIRIPDLSRVRKAIGFQARIPLDRTIDDLAEEFVR